MRKFIIASHGYYAKGISDALSLIAGENEQIHVVSAFVDGKDTGDIFNEIKTILGAFPDDEFLIMTDLLGGSVNTECMNFIHNENIHLVAGINLLFLLTVVTASDKEDINNLIDRAIEDARKGIVYCNKVVKGSYDDF